MRRMIGANLTWSIRDIVGNPDCVASDDGQRVYNRVAAGLKQGNEVSISFRDVSTLTWAFLNAAIGRLYGTFSKNEIRSKLKVKDMQPGDLALLKRVVQTAQQYFKDSKRFNKAVQDAIGA